MTDSLPKESIILCPTCNKLSYWNSHFQKYMCDNKDCKASTTLDEYELWVEYNKTTT